MAKFRSRMKKVLIEALTFDELVAYGMAHGGNIVNGMPWWFHFHGYLITYENDKCYLVNTREGRRHITPDDMLIYGRRGEVYPCQKDRFEATYEAC